MNFEHEPAEPPIIEITIDGLEMALSWLNTTLFCHREPYTMYDHAFVDLGEDKGAYLWRQNVKNFDEIADNLLDLDFSYHFAPYPSQFDVGQYDRMMANQAERADEYLARWSSGKD